MAILGGLFLWLLRLTLAPPSTIAGFRRWALDECPVAPGRTAPRPALEAPGSHPPGQRRGKRGRTDKTASRRAWPGKQARMLALAGQRHDLASLPLKQVSAIANAIGAEVDLSPGTARRVLLAHVRSVQNGHHQPGHDPQEEGTR